MIPDRGNYQRNVPVEENALFVSKRHNPWGWNRVLRREGRYEIRQVMLVQIMKGSTRTLELHGFYLTEYI